MTPSGSSSSTTAIGRCILYETKTRFYCVQSDPNEVEYRILKIHRPHIIGGPSATTASQTLSVVEDEAVYTKTQVMDLLRMIDDGNKATGGLKRLMRIHGIIGFVRFLEGFYIYVITGAELVADLGGHLIYTIRDTRLISVGSTGLSVGNGEYSSQEQRYIDVFCSLDLSKNFYFSFTYDLTHSFQYNATRYLNDTDVEMTDVEKAYQDMFVWNHYLLRQGFEDIHPGSHWVLPIIHGFIQQSNLSVMGRKIVLTLIARRSRRFAGARFLKRGVNDQGFVANDVESEQIVYDASLAGRRCFPSKCTSFVQHRGSIPLYWSQDLTTMSPKPPIQINFADPFYSAASLHFDNMLKRYGAPIIALNLVKHNEKTKRESILLEEYTHAISYLNQFLPDESKIKYVAFDMSRAAKSPDQDVLKILEKIATQAIKETGFFFTEKDKAYCQTGVIRTNCIDCLDRTNAAQFIIGQCALAHQLCALDLVSDPHIPLECEATKLLMEMYHDHGDTIALQYGGSALVNTMETYRKTNAWSSQSRDMIETIKRYYSNSFTDAEKQDAINLFLGNYVTHKDAPLLWELDSDFYLHHQDPWATRERPSYIHWFHPEYLKQRHCVDGVKPTENSFENYYEPARLTSFDSHFQSSKADPSDSPSLMYKPSPFINPALEDFTLGKNRATRSFSTVSAPPNRQFSLPEESRLSISLQAPPAGRRGIQLMTPSTAALTTKLLNPTVSQSEMDEYERYLNQFKPKDLGRSSPIEKSHSLSAKGTPSAIRTRAPNIDDPQHYVYYEEYLQKAEKLCEFVHETSAKDQEIFSKFVSLQDPSTAIAQFYKMNGYDGYRRWLATGRYSVQPFTGNNA